jgi:hypothetical protein
MLIEHILMRFKIMNIHDKYNGHVNSLIGLGFLNSH